MSWLSSLWKKNDMKEKINSEVKKYIETQRIPILVILKLYLAEPIAGQATNSIIDLLNKKVDTIW